MQEATNDNNRANNTPRKNGRLQLVLIVLIPLLVIGLSSLMYYSGLFIPETRTNKGELILPPKSLASFGLSYGGGVFTEEHLDGSWAVLVIGDGSCTSEMCQEAMYQTRQALIALGKDADRVARVYVAVGVPGVSDQFREEHPGVFWLRADQGNLLNALDIKTWPIHRYFIVDPLGNVMMGYRPVQSGGDLLKDIKKLLKASKIG